MTRGWYRSAAAVLGGVLLSFALVTFVGAVLVHTSEIQLFFSAMQQGQSGRDLPEGGATKVLTAMDVTFFRIRWMMGLGIVAVVGIFVGFVARVRVWQMAILAAIPFAFFFSGSWSGSSAVMVSALYVGVAGFAAWLISKWLRRQTDRAPNTGGGV
jgi:hypothetical protein